MKSPIYKLADAILETMTTPKGALPKNLIELLAFVPACKEIRKDADGHWICTFTQPATEDEQQNLKLRFGFSAGIVTANQLRIDRSYLYK